MILLGRREEREAVATRFAEGHRIVTLVGPTGVGKSHLAHALARVAVSLEDASTEDDVDRALEGALEQTLARGEAGPVLVDQVDDALDVIAPRLAHHASRVPLLVTGHERLGLRDEAVIVLSPLGVPPRTATPAEVLASDAVALLVATAQASGVDVAAIPAEQLAEIARRLDGLPLAIVLAAPRLRALGPSVMLDRLRAPHRVLDRGPRDAPPRHRSLERALRCAWELLSPSQQALLARLSGHVGAFSLAEVADAEMRDLEALCDRSMIQPSGEGFRILAPVQAFALEEGLARGWLASEALLARAGALFDRGRLRDALATLDAVPPSGPAAELRVAALRRLGRWDEARTLAERALAAASDDEASHRLRGALATLDLELGDLEAAREQLLVVRRSTADPKSRALADGMIGHADQELGELGAAAERYDAAREAFLRLGERRLAAAYAGYRASVAHERGDADAEARYRHAIDEVAPLAPPFAALFAASLGALLADRGDGEAAEQAFARADQELAGCTDAAIRRAVAIHRTSLVGALDGGGASDESRGVTSDDVRFAMRLRQARAQGLALALRCEDQRVILGDLTIDLTRRPTLWRLLEALIEARQRGTEASRDALIAAAWGDERILPKAAAHRLRVAIHELRRMGLRSVLKREGDGYALTCAII
ncbi:MAG: ATP-binding protein [Myxococcales bacterium]|nr:ATP-binding protein [Myxococcales bacterium]